MATRRLKDYVSNRQLMRSSYRKSPGALRAMAAGDPEEFQVRSLDPTSPGRKVTFQDESREPRDAALLEGLDQIKQVMQELVEKLPERKQFGSPRFQKNFNRNGGYNRNFGSPRSGSPYGSPRSPGSGNGNQSGSPSGK